MRRRSGQTSSELMLVISVIVVAVVGSSLVFVPRFRTGVGILGANVRDVLATGSFSGLGLKNVGTDWDAVQGQTGASGGADADGNVSTSPMGPPGMGNAFAMWIAHYPPFIAQRIQQMFANIQRAQQSAQLANQESGEAPPTGITGNICGQWAVSFIASMLGVEGVTLQNAINISNQYHLGAGLGDAALRAGRLSLLAAISGLSARYNNGNGKSYGESRDWLVKQLENGRYPAVLVSRNGEPHWMVVMGVVKDEFGRVTGMRLRDSINPEEQVMDNSAFEEAWAAHARESVSIGTGHGFNLFTASATPAPVATPGPSSN